VHSNHIGLRNGKRINDPCESARSKIHSQAGPRTTSIRNQHTSKERVRDGALSRTIGSFTDRC